MTHDTDCLSYKEAADLLEVDHRHVRKLRRKGKLEEATLPDGRPGVTRTSVQEYQRTRTRGAPSRHEEE